MLVQGPDEVSLHGQALVVAADNGASIEFGPPTMEEALARHGTPEILNTDQGSQFTSIDFIKVLAAREISMVC